MPVSTCSRAGSCLARSASGGGPGGDVAGAVQHGQQAGILVQPGGEAVQHRDHRPGAERGANRHAFRQMGDEEVPAAGGAQRPGHRRGAQAIAIRLHHAGHRTGCRAVAQLAPDCRPRRRDRRSAPPASPHPGHCAARHGPGGGRRQASDCDEGLHGTAIKVPQPSAGHGVPLPAGTIVTRFTAGHNFPKPGIQDRTGPPPARHFNEGNSLWLKATGGRTRSTARRRRCAAAPSRRQGQEPRSLAAPARRPRSRATRHWRR